MVVRFVWAVTDPPSDPLYNDYTVTARSASGIPIAGRRAALADGHTSQVVRDATTSLYRVGQVPPYVPPEPPPEDPPPPPEDPPVEP
jgi:hypothetical protein